MLASLKLALGSKQHAAPRVLQLYRVMLCHLPSVTEAVLVALVAPAVLLEVSHPHRKSGSHQVSASLHQARQMPLGADAWPALLKTLYIKQLHQHLQAWHHWLLRRREVCHHRPSRCAPRQSIQHPAKAIPLGQVRQPPLALPSHLGDSHQWWKLSLSDLEHQSFQRD